MIPKLKEESDIILVQFHSETTAETATLFHYLDGKVAAVIGSHNKVLTADSIVSEKGTAFISDNGRTGSSLSVGGFLPEVEIEKFVKALPLRSREEWNKSQLQGVIVTIENDKAVNIEVMKIDVDVKKPEVKSESRC